MEPVETLERTHPVFTDIVKPIPPELQGEAPPMEPEDLLTPPQKEWVQALAFDPGKTTGYAYLDSHSLEEVGQLSHLNEVGDLIAEIMPDVIVYESYPRNWARHNDFHYPVEVIGVIKYASYGVNRPTVPQTPGMVKCGYWTIEKMKAIGLYQVGKPHARDAVRHLLHWFTFTHGDPYFKDLYEKGKK